MDWSHSWERGDLGTETRGGPQTVAQCYDWRQ